jgi:hypothetical protein
MRLGIRDNAEGEGEEAQETEQEFEKGLVEVAHAFNCIEEKVKSYPQQKAPCGAFCFLRLGRRP